jgi:hypothetical protein
MKSENLAVIFSVCFAFASAADAQRAEPDVPSERDTRPAAPLPTLGTGEEAPPADNSTAATADSSSICQLIESAAAANGLPFEFFSRSAVIRSRLASSPALGGRVVTRPASTYSVPSWGPSAWGCCAT